MKYKIDIWQWHNKVKTYKNNDIKEILKWYKENWQRCYENGGCTFYLYEDNKEIDFDNAYKLGFY